MTETSTTEVPAQKTIRLLGAVPKSLVAGFVGAAARLAHLLSRLRVSPNVLSVIGLLAGLAAGVLFAFGKPLWGALSIVICGLFDILDGQVAKESHRKSLYGAIFDSTLDRYSEFFIYLGLAVHFRNRWPLWVVFFTFLGSAMVSYTRARAEGLGIPCRVGFMQRAERMVLLVLAAVLGSLFQVFDQAMIAAVAVIALVSNFTAFQRVFYVRNIEIHKNTNKEV